jgi:hypothetical protein
LSAVYVVGWQFVGQEVFEEAQPSTPLVLGAWERLLVGYPGWEFLCGGIRDGLSLGVEDVSGLRPAAVREVSAPLLREKVEAEVSLGRILGPFARPPVVGLQLSPVSLVEKRTSGKFRLIHNLSAPRGRSVNEAIPDDKKSVSYCRVADAVAYINRCGSQVGLQLSKFDIKDAFRIVPVEKASWKFLGMTVDGAYFVDTRLPMGCGTSCAVFQALSSALAWAMEVRCPGVRVFGYLDDFLLVSRGLEEAVEHVSQFELLCEELGVMLASEKTLGPTSRLVFLGIGLDVSAWQLYLEESKVVETLDKLDGVLQRKALKRVEWQSLVGTLSFLCQVVIPGRAFMSRLCRKLAGSRFWIHLDSSSRADIVA